jgi:hypothetical protein
VDVVDEIEGVDLKTKERLVSFLFSPKKKKKQNKISAINLDGCTFVWFQ